MRCPVVRQRFHSHRGVLGRFEDKLCLRQIFYIRYIVSEKIHLLCWSGKQIAEECNGGQGGIGGSSRSATGGPKSGGAVAIKYGVDYRWYQWLIQDVLKEGGQNWK